jgi:Arv1-like family
MLLHKPQVYRHLLYNRGLAPHPFPSPSISLPLHPPNNPVISLLHYSVSFFNAIVPWKSRNLFRLWVLLNLIEIYMKWFKQEQAFGLFLPSEQFLPHFLYLFLMAIAESSLFQSAVYISVLIIWAGPSSLFSSFHADSAKAPTFQHIGTALVVSSFCKLIIMFMVIWDFGELAYAWLINIFVLTSNAEAIYALLHLEPALVSTHRVHTATLSPQYRAIFFIIIVSHALRWGLQLAVHHYADPSYPVYIL